VRERRQQEEIEEMGRTIAQALIEEGQNQGFVKAKQEDLLALVEEKFGPPSAGVSGQVQAIHDAERLSLLIRRTLTASTLSDLGLTEG
jgi:hypothetical protein